MKSKEEKIYTYIALFIGSLIWFLYFFLDNYNFSFTTDFEETRFRNFWRTFLGSDLSHFFWMILQIFFLISCWYIRNDIVKIIKKLHNKI
jgi:hypothetical protein